MFCLCNKPFYLKFCFIFRLLWEIKIMEVGKILTLTFFLFFIISTHTSYNQLREALVMTLSHVVGRALS
jgi:hypothetical protein